MLFSILQEITTHELVEYSEEYIQRSLSSWAAVNEYDIEEEQFELYSQEVELNLEVPNTLLTVASMYVNHF